MRYLAAIILLVPLGAAVPLSIDVSNTRIEGGNITVNVVMDSAETVYGYELDVMSSANFQTYTYGSRVQNHTNSFTILNSSTIRTASVGFGIPAGNGPVVTLTYSSNQTGPLNFLLNAQAYAQNGSAIQTTQQDGQTTVEGNLIRINDAESDQTTTNVTLCMQNAEALTSMTISLAYENLTLTDATTTYVQTDTGANITFGNINASNDCTAIATMTFAINATPGSAHAIGIAAAQTTPALALGFENGTVQYNSYSLNCPALSAYRNTTAQLSLILTNYTGLQTLHYDVTSTLNFSGIESDLPTSTNNGIDHNITSVPQPLATLNLTIHNESNGTYTVLLTNISANGELIEHDDLTCPLTIATNCVDLDSDNFSSGLECNTNQTLDCDDNSAAVHPNATETCNALDDNCDGTIDEGCPSSGGGVGGSGGGGGASSGDSSSSSAGSASGSAASGFSAFANLPTQEETSTIQEDMPAPVQKPIKTELKSEPPAPALEEPRKVNLLAYIMGVLIMLAAGVLTWYEWVKHKK